MFSTVWLYPNRINWKNTVKSHLKDHEKKRDCDTFLQGNGNWAHFLRISDDRDINDTDSQGNTPLTLACKGGNIDLVHALLKNGAKINVPRKDGASPLWIASFYDHQELVVKLLRENGVDINQQSLDGTTPLYIASELNHYEVVKCLLERKAKVDLCHKDGCTPLWIASCRGYLNIVKLLTENGANVNAQLYGSEASVLHIATEKNRLDVVQYLLSKNANVNLPRKNHAIPLHEAAYSYYDSQSIVKLLIDSKSDVNKQCVDGETPLIFAASRGNIEAVELLLLNGADKDINHMSRGVLCGSALHCAAVNGQLRTTRLLLKYGAKVQKNDKDQFPSEVATNPTIITLLKDNEQHEQRKNRRKDSTICLSDSLWLWQFDTTHMDKLSTGTTQPLMIKEQAQGEEQDMSWREMTPLSKCDRKELNLLYKEFKEQISRTPMPDFIRQTYAGNFDKKIFVICERETYCESRKYLSDEFQELWSKNIIELCEETEGPKLAMQDAEVAQDIIKPVGPGSKYVHIPPLVTNPTLFQMNITQFFEHLSDLLLIENVSNENMNLNTGSIACFARDTNGNTYALTAMHPLQQETGTKTNQILLSEICINTSNIKAIQVIDLSNEYHGIFGGICIGEGTKCVIDIAVLPLSTSLLTCSTLSSYSTLPVYQLEDDTDIFYRFVEKCGATTGVTEGIVIKSNIDELKDGITYDGVFLVSGCKQTRGTNNRPHYEPDDTVKFADVGDSGALVKLQDDETSPGLGIVYKVQENWHDKELNKYWKHVTYCIRLDNCLLALEQKFGFDLKLYDVPLKLILQLRKTENKPKRQRAISL